MSAPWTGVERAVRGYLRRLRRLTRGYAATHEMARELLRLLDLPGSWPRSVSNRLLARRVEVELELDRLADDALEDVAGILRLDGRRGGGVVRVEERVKALFCSLCRAGRQCVREGRMRYFRTLIWLVGAEERRVLFLYAGGVGGWSRPFCVTRAGRIFDLGEVLSWERTGREQVWCRCGGAGCGHLLLPVTRAGMVRERFFNRVAVVPRGCGVVATVGPERFWDAGSDIGKWHEAAFGHAVPLVRRVVGLAGSPAGGIRNTPGERRMMFVMDRGVPHIEMGAAVPVARLSRLERLLWRHEFGHYIDYWINGFMNGPCSFHDLGLRRALRMDGRAMVMRAGLQGSCDWRLRSALRTGQVLHGLLEHMVGLSSAARLAWIRQELGGFGLTLEQVEGALEVEVAYPGFAVDPVRLVLLLTALRRRDPFLFGEQVLEWWRHRESGMVLSVADFFGAMTNNFIGYGHAEAYYQESPMRCGSEAFANGVVLFGDGNPFWGRLLLIMAPRFAGRLLAILSAVDQVGVGERRFQAAR
ncbi:MAG: hypothetical protein HQM01_10510 [Magnetococcales bacterium]|nr:hypothetical protein [Magnetococcales bacterium]